MESTEFDSTLGGAEHLPYSANIFKFAASRSVEIAAMTESILRPSKTKLIFQNLPVHMRRRVMSHNCKRLPKHLRHGHLEQLHKSGLPPQQKPPCRKYRRRATNLLEEYNRRKRRNIWLETHIWHAKRFHMIDRWGHRLAYSPCDKAFRACYRATSAHCLLQDISYFTPIRIQGPIDDISSIFNPMSSKLCGLSVTAKAYVSGNREGTIHLYKPYMYPFGYIGKVQFIWVLKTNMNKELWLFVHPSQANIIESVLNGLINDEHSALQSCGPKRQKLNTEDTRKVIIETMAGAFNRFCLTGPQSQAILVKCLKCISDCDTTKQNDWVTQCTLDSQLHLKEKYEYWHRLCTANAPSQVPPRLVLGLIVKDPRLSRPKKRSKAQVRCNKTIPIPSFLNVPLFSSFSPLWDDSVRDKIKSSRVSNPEFVEHITKTQLIPGEINADHQVLQSIPIVLIQRPGSQDYRYKKIGYGSGWDIIIPAGYGLPFWLTFIMFGARSGGLRETENLSLELGQYYLPPDSETGNIEEKKMESKLKQQYFKRPPSKRVNFIIHGISSPFICPWNILLKDWCSDKIDDFFVLRDKFQLHEIEACLNSKKKLETIQHSDRCLVAVYIQISGKGNLGNQALICMPQADDITSKNLSEPQHEDVNFKIRKLKRLEHRKKLRQIKKKQLQLRQKTKKPIGHGKPRTSTEPSEYVKEMRNLWLPNDVNTVRFVAARETMGYIAKAAYSFTEAKSCGIGYIAYNALCELLNNGFNQVLVRNTSSLKYRPAKIQIIKEL